MSHPIRSTVSTQTWSFCGIVGCNQTLSACRPLCVWSSRAFWEEAGGAVQGARRSEAGFTLPTAQRGSVPGEAQAGGARRPPEGGLRSVQVSHTTQHADGE